MRCRNAKEWLGAQRDINNELPEAQKVKIKEHLKECAFCRAREQQHRQIETMLVTTTPKVPPIQSASISTNDVMRAIKQQKKISQQVEEIQRQQQIRMARMRTVGAASAALAFFTLSSVPLLFLAITIIQTDLALKTLAFLNDLIEVLIIGGQYLQMGLILVTRDNWLLSGMAFVVVVMMGMWLRLMRAPQET
jgi:predicted anti-sigma-YlaC factor YlaD